MYTELVFTLQDFTFSKSEETQIHCPDTYCDV